MSSYVQTEMFHRPFPITNTEDQRLPLPQSLFVYGTLRTDLGPPSMRGDLPADNSIGYAYLSYAKMYSVGSAYPAVVPSDNHEDVVHGQILSYEDYSEGDWKHILSGLDSYEGVPSLYTRELVNVTLSNDEATTADVWTYVYARGVDPLTPIENGDWKVHYEEIISRGRDEMAGMFESAQEER